MRKPVAVLCIHQATVNTTFPSLATIFDIPMRGCGLLKRIDSIYDGSQFPCLDEFPEQRKILRTETRTPLR